MQTASRLNSNGVISPTPSFRVLYLVGVEIFTGLFREQFTGHNTNRVDMVFVNHLAIFFAERN